MKIKSSLYGTVIIASVFSCDEFVKINLPQTQIVSGAVYTEDAMATSVVAGIYSEMMATDDFASGGSSSVGVLAGLSADELDNFSSSSDANAFNLNLLLPTNATLRNQLWAKAYKLIYYTNAVLEGLNSSTTITKATSTQLQGEAKFIRAFCYFYLVNLFGDVPLALVTDYRQNIGLSRSSVDVVYAQITQDLLDASAMLAPDYASVFRIRPNRAAASSLLARVYLYTSQWTNAENTSTEVINQTNLYSLVPLDSVFLAHSKEAIWQLMPVTQSIDTWEGSIFVLNSAPYVAALKDDFTQAFEENDLRKVSWIHSITVGDVLYYFPYKYKIQTGERLDEFSMVLRFAEQYLIRAEAKAQQNNIIGAQADINTIRNRAGLSMTTASDKSTLLLAIEQERKVELFTEWGHRWLDLKRTNRVDLILGLTKGGNWKTTDALYPIPQAEILGDPNLKQNPGY